MERMRLSAARVLTPRNALTTSQQLARFVLTDGFESDGGERVNEVTAMQYADVHACVRVLSEDIAALPLILYERTAKGKDRKTEHWLFDLLQRPNPWQNGFQFRQLQQAHLELCGNFFALKTVVNEEVRELLPIAPSRVTIEQDLRTYAVTYTVNWPDGGSSVVPNDKMYHIRTLSLDGVRGLNPIQYYRQTIGNGVQMVKFGNKLFRNGTMLGGVLSTTQKLSDQARKHLKESFDEKYSGMDNAGKTIVLEEGLSFTATGITSVDAQFLESRKFTRSQIAGLFRVPPHLIADMERATFSNIEEQSRGYVTFGLLPRLRNIEGVANQSLIPKSLQRKLYVEHLVEGLLRARSSERVQFYQSAVATGWMSRNEVREKENLNPGPAELDEFLEPKFLTGSPTQADLSENTAPKKDGDQ